MYIEDYLKNRKYPGRILICGSLNDSTPILAYCVMGRSEKSRNRVLRLNGAKLTTELFDNSTKGDDLIIYSAKEVIGKYLLLGNGDHVGSIASSLREGKTLIESLSDIYPEPDSPNYTPRISLLYDLESLSYSLAIVKKNGDKIDRIVWNCPCIPGFGHIIHTYSGDEDPLPSFDGDPVLLNFSSDSYDICTSIWSSLDFDNKVAIYFFDGITERIINKKEEENGEN